MAALPKAIQIRDVPDAVHRQLRAQAAAAGMSLSDYLRREVSRIAGKPSLAEVLARAREDEPMRVSGEEIAAMIRERRGPLPEDE